MTTDVINSGALSGDRARILAAALSGLSKNSCRVYKRHLSAFLDWLPASGSTLHRESAVAYLTMHYAQDVSTYNQALSAIKRLAAQAAENGWLSWHAARPIDGIPSKRLRGSHAGNWLTLSQATALVALPNARTVAGRRDKAVLALLLGCGLRRDELSKLSVEQRQPRDGRTMLIDVLGKGSRLRTLTVPQWADTIVQAWLDASRVSSGPLVRSFKPDGRINGSLSVTAIWDIVQRYASALGISCTPHDLRRTFATLARQSNAPLEVIQKSLGHSSISTTERYLRTADHSNAGDFFAL